MAWKKEKRLMETALIDNKTENRREEEDSRIATETCLLMDVWCKLPFLPISWLQGLSHRNLLGDDYTDCSFIFLYILCTRYQTEHPEVVGLCTIESS
ncbi:Calcium load-activated calcium channel-like 2 [Homarus americanus]|uniref:Calcium load-activated calcium channel-like 2 n=1 Tax=Homarus americanus TaxID=6706 RepID=A0A8J5MJW9_HOMAM|nr:Calcium load-activated calcium channel-like 2 [Homarus americanus]